MNDKVKSYLSTIYKFQEILNSGSKQYMDQMVEKKPNGEYELTSDFQAMTDKDIRKIYRRCRDGLRLDGEINQCLNKNVARRDLVKLHDHTPEILQQVGLDDLPVFMSKGHVEDCLTPKSKKNPHLHGLLKGDILSTLDMISDSILICDDMNGDGLICVLDAFDHDVPDPLLLMVSIKIDREVEYGTKKDIKSNFVASIYGKKNIIENTMQKALDDGRILAIDKKKIQSLMLQLKPNAQVSHKFQAFITSLSQGNNLNFKRFAKLKRLRNYLNNFEYVDIIQQTKNKVNKKLSGNANSKKKVKKKQTSTQSQAVAQQAPPTQQAPPVQQTQAKLTPQQQQNFYLGTQGVNLSHYSASVIQKSIPLAGTEEGTQALIAKAKANRASSVTQSNRRVSRL